MSKYRVAVIGSGNWGSAIARIVGLNTREHPALFEPQVKMWVYDEVLHDGRRLTDVINEEHENVKYLPGRKFTDNVVADPDIVSASVDADILVLVVPHQFLSRTLSPLRGGAALKSGVVGISLIKGLHHKSAVDGKQQTPDSAHSGGADTILNGSKDGGSTAHHVSLISDFIRDQLGGIPISVLMGANIAHEVADGEFCETTIGLANGTNDSPVKDDMVAVYKTLFQRPQFRVTVVSDARTVELCGALKNVVACAAGFCDGLDTGGNTKAAIIRLGLVEMIKFAQTYFGPSLMSTFFESCGVADLVTTCYGGRNRRVSEAFARCGGVKSVEQLESEMLDGQKLQGPETAAEVYDMLQQDGSLHEYPVMVAVHLACIGEISPAEILDRVGAHPEHQ